MGAGGAVRNNTVPAGSAAGPARRLQRGEITTAGVARATVDIQAGRRQGGGSRPKREKPAQRAGQRDV